jgi:hypothetical protein
MPTKWGVSVSLTVHFRRVMRIVCLILLHLPDTIHIESIVRASVEKPVDIHTMNVEQTCSEFWFAIFWLNFAQAAIVDDRTGKALREMRSPVFRVAPSRLHQCLQTGGRRPEQKLLECLIPIRRFCP